ncbi:MFS transporter [[Eubacterium] cellulosolvens]
MKSFNLLLNVVILSHGLNHILQLVLPTILPTLILEFEISNYTAGLLVACFLLPYSLLQIPFGYLSDRKGRKKILVIGIFLYSLGTLLCGLSQNILQLGINQFIAGVGGASYHPIGIPLASLAVEKSKRGQAMGFHQTGGAIGAFIAPLVSAYIAVFLGWRYSFIFLSIFGFILGLFIWTRIDKSKLMDTKNEGISNLRSILTNQKVVRLIILLFTFGLLHVISYRALTPFLTTYAITKHSLGLESAAQLLSLLQIMGIIGSPLFGRISDGFGRKPTLYIIMMSQAIVMYLITYSSVGTLVILLGVMGLIAFGCLAVTDTWITEMNFPQIMGTLVGVAVSASFLIGAIITPIVGFLADQVGFDYAFRIIAILTLTGIPILKIVTDKS